MNITDVRVRKIAKEGKMRAVVSITIDDEFVVHDIKVIEGDLTDLRWEDPSNVIVGLKAKGLAKSDDTGFVIQPKLINNINI